MAGAKWQATRYPAALSRDSGAFDLSGWQPFFTMTSKTPAPTGEIG